MPGNKSERRIKYINPPSKCDICNGPFIYDCFYDAKTSRGGWANMCAVCFYEYGVGLGTGLGQEYHKNGINWYKTRG